MEDKQAIAKIIVQIVRKDSPDEKFPEWDKLSESGKQFALEGATRILQTLTSLGYKSPEELKKEIGAERNRVHIEINKMLEPLKLHLCWITGSEIASEQYGLADEDGDDVDFVSIFEPALNDYEGYVKMVEQKQCQYWFPVDGEWKCQK